MLSGFISSKVSLKELTRVWIHCGGHDCVERGGLWDHSAAGAGQWSMTRRFAADITRHNLVFGQCTSSVGNAFTGSFLIFYEFQASSPTASYQKIGPKTSAGDICLLPSCKPTTRTSVTWKLRVPSSRTSTADRGPQRLKICKWHRQWDAYLWKPTTS